MYSLKAMISTEDAISLAHLDIHAAGGDCRRERNRTMVDSGCLVLDVVEMNGSDELVFSLSANSESNGKSITS